MDEDYIEHIGWIFYQLSDEAKHIKRGNREKTGNFSGDTLLNIIERICNKNYKQLNGQLPQNYVSIVDFNSKYQNKTFIELFREFLITYNDTSLEYKLKYKKTEDDIAKIYNSMTESSSYDLI